MVKHYTRHIPVVFNKYRYPGQIYKPNSVFLRGEEGWSFIFAVYPGVWGHSLAKRATSLPQRHPPLFDLAPGGVYRAVAVTGRRGALLPHLFTLTPHPFNIGRRAIDRYENKNNYSFFRFLFKTQC